MAYTINCAFHNMTMMYKRDQQHNSNSVLHYLSFWKRLSHKLLQSSGEVRNSMVVVCGLNIFKLLGFLVFFEQHFRLVQLIDYDFARCYSY